MQTRVFSVGDHRSFEDAVEQGALILKKGGLVVFPTETVYGLGANALDPSAVAKIYEAKGRPAKNPLIIHVSSKEQAKELVTQWPKAADLLVEQFWPGPLTLILPKADHVPDIVTGGGKTVAIRMPDHKFARALLEAVNLPIAAPSANQSEQLSATTAQHVLKGLEGKVDLIIDGGQTPGGLESTVIDLTVDPPVIRRPGLLSREMIAAVIDLGVTSEPTEKGPLVSPGMMVRHYAPAVPLELSDSVPASDDSSAGYLLLQGTDPPAGVTVIEYLPRDAKGYAAGLYSALHHLEVQPIKRIIVQTPPKDPGFEAVHDRLERAQG